MLTTRKTALAAIVASLMLSACGGSSSNDNSGNDDTGSSNAAPTAISLDGSSVEENMTGAEIGTLTVTDEDDDSHTFSVDDERFTVTDGTLMLAEGQALNFEKAASVTLNVTATDSADNSWTEEFTIDVTDVLDTYSFDSVFTEESSVSYSGQIARHLLINDLNDLINDELGDVNDFTYTTRQEVMNDLEKYFSTSSDDYSDIFGILPLRTETTPAAKQTYLTDISDSHKNLIGKIAGNDAKGQHKDWNNGDFAGWGTTGSTTPTELVRSFFNELADNADAQIAGSMRLDPFGNEITKVYLTEDGRDLKQLIQKFLLMAVPYSQAADDYLDHDTEGKGLMTDNTSQDDGAAFTTLEHQFDEGFGYFGAARDYLDYSDDEAAGKGGRDGWSNGYHDTDGDEAIDFESEYNFGQSVNAAKRDRGATVATDFSAEAMNAFLQGRQLINENASTALTDTQMEELKGYRDTALANWEKAIAATVVHYINDTIADLDAIGTEEFSYADLAKHWSEMKGFALGLQFNRFSPVSDADFVSLHDKIGTAPVLTDDAAVTTYQEGLLEARDILQAAYEFDAENVQNW